MREIDENMSDEVNYEGWALDMCSLLDAIEMALSDGEIEKAHTLIIGRHQIAEAHGLKVEFMGTQAAGIQ